jgi:hypothetical protein
MKKLISFRTGNTKNGTGLFIDFLWGWELMFFFINHNQNK